MICFLRWNISFLCSFLQKKLLEKLILILKFGQKHAKNELMLSIPCKIVQFLQFNKLHLDLFGFFLQFLM